MLYPRISLLPKLPQHDPSIFFYCSTGVVTKQMEHTASKINPAGVEIKLAGAHNYISGSG